MRAIPLLSGNLCDMNKLNLKYVSSEILIIVPRYFSSREKSYYEFPLGLAYISACLKQNNYKVDVLNLNHYEGIQEELICRKILGGKYKYVLTGGLSAHYRQIKGIVESVQKLNSGIITVVGGGAVTAMPEVMYNYIKPDYIVLGEGEITIVELMNELFNGNKKCNNVKGIGFRDASGQFILTTSRLPVIDLDQLPWPDLEGFEIENYLATQKPNDSLYLYINDKPRFYPIISSRGCPYNCSFCYHPLGRKYRSRSVDDFIKEVEYVINTYKVNNLAIFDELLSNDRNRLYEICTRLKNLSDNLHWMCQLRVDSVDEEMLKVMKDAGCFIISYGFESVSDVVLKSMKKKVNKAQIEKAMKLTREAGIGIQGYFIFGDTAETAETANETLQFWNYYKDYHITMGYVRPYPGSILWNKEVENRRLSTPQEQLSFLDQCIYDPPNISRMNDKEWFELKKEVQKAIIMNNNYGEFISSRRNGNNNYMITVRCPHCSEDVIYDNYEQRILGVFKMSCRKCNQSMNMTPLVFDHVRDEYSKNQKVYMKIKENNVQVVVTPCMNPAEFQAMAEIYLTGVKIHYVMDIDQSKTGNKYLGIDVLQRTKENIESMCKGSYFIIPLTRYANKIINHLLTLGVDINHICRLDEIMPGYLSIPN